MKALALWLLAATVALLLACTQLDGPDELDALRDTAADVQEAQQAAQSARRLVTPLVTPLVTQIASHTALAAQP